MNILSLDKRAQIITLLAEGNSVRGCARIADVSFNTVLKTVKTVGIACKKFHEEKVVNIKAQQIQMDEIWSFVYTRERGLKLKRRFNNAKGIGNFWVWMAMDAKTKLLISWHVGKREAKDALAFMHGLANKLDKEHRFQVTTDGYKLYPDAIDNVFGATVDYAKAVRILKEEPRVGYSDKETFYKKQVKLHKQPVTGNPNLEYVSTNFIERNNLNIRMNSKRFTRDTNAFSKSFEYHCYAIALQFVYHNFCRIHKTLRVTPAMEGGLTDDIMTAQDIAKMTYHY